MESRLAGANALTLAGEVLRPVVERNLLEGAVVGLQLIGQTDMGYADEVTSDDAAGYWRLGETSGSTAFDASGRAHNGTYANGVQLGVAGALSGDINTAARFDGSNDMINIADHVDFRPSQITLEAWVRPDTTVGTYDTVIMKTSSSSWNDGYGIYCTSTGTLAFYVNNWSTHRVLGSVALETWSHVVGTYDGTTLKLYINGALVDSLAYTAAIAHSSQPLRIGAGEGNYIWDGNLDEVAAYGLALTEERIRAHYQAGLATGPIRSGRRRLDADARQPDFGCDGNQARCCRTRADCCERRYRRWRRLGHPGAVHGGGLQQRHP